MKSIIEYINYTINEGNDNYVEYLKKRAEIADKYDHDNGPEIDKKMDAQEQKEYDALDRKYPDAAARFNKEQLDNLRGNSRANDLLNTMREDVDLVDLMQVFLIEKICDIYPAHSLVTNDFRQELINRCNYFTDKNVNVRNVNEVEELDKEVITEDTENK